jgi:hypothetical protein
MRQVDIPHNDPRRMLRQLPGVNGAVGGHAAIEGAGDNGHHAPRGLKRGRSTDSSSSSACSSSDTSSNDTSSDDTSSSSESSSDSDRGSTSSSSSEDLPPRHRHPPRPPQLPEFPKPPQPSYVIFTVVGMLTSTVLVAADPHQSHPDSGNRRRTCAMSAVEKNVLLNVRVMLPHRILQARSMRYPLALLSLYPRQSR